MLRTITLRRLHLIVSVLCCISFSSEAQTARQLLDKGWQELIVDNDTSAFMHFSEALTVAKTTGDTELIAESLIDLGICTYSVSYTKGMKYCYAAMDEYKKLSVSKPIAAIQGKSRCLLLLSTINGRQGKFDTVLTLSRQALEGFSENDTTSHTGLVYNSLGTAYEKLSENDSAEYYYRKALSVRERNNDYTYLPVSYLKIADIERKKGNESLSRELNEKAYNIADHSGNRQAIVSSLLGKGEWVLFFKKDFKLTEAIYKEALVVASELSDKSFYLQSLNHLIELMKQKGDYAAAFKYQQEAGAMKDKLSSWENEKIVQSLLVQFDVAEKERQLVLTKKEKDVIRLTNYVLWISLASLLLIAGGIIVFLRRINKRNKQLLVTRQALMEALEMQKRLKEQEMMNDLDHKENQLSALTMQMVTKNELMQELHEKLSQNKDIAADPAFARIINKGQSQDKDWSDFNAYFESINKSFYAKLKNACPDISPNDLKICALIKMNLSIKEMAGVLGISPDSVKTARYRLRKKLQLNTEDNLTDYLLNL